MQDTIKRLLIQLGEDPKRDELLDTPRRVEEAWSFLVSGNKQNPKKLIEKSLFPTKLEDMVLVKDIPLYSLCEHHLLPFYGKAHVGYIPDGKIVGISKISQLVDIFARRLQVQERLTHQIAETLMKALKPKGVAVVVKASHLCMQMRGEEKHGTEVVTSSMLGAFRRRPETRSEFMNLIR